MCSLNSNMEIVLTISEILCLPIVDIHASANKTGLSFDSYMDSCNFFAGLRSFILSLL